MYHCLGYLINIYHFREGLCYTMRVQFITRLSMGLTLRTTINIHEAKEPFHKVYQHIHFYREDIPKSKPQTRF